SREQTIRTHLQASRPHRTAQSQGRRAAKPDPRERGHSRAPTLSGSDSPRSSRLARREHPDAPPGALPAPPHGPTSPVQAQTLEGNVGRLGFPGVIICLKSTGARERDS
ncbi:hypothetical protein H1C71_038974, partial [Ictidomys tridecemlineatus]